ncbi:potassium transporter TrkH, partial [Pelagibacteraceae bacterium GOM-A4]
IEINAIIFIILGSIPFISYIKYLAGDKKIFFKDTQIKTFIILVIISILLMFFYLSVINKSLTEISFLSVSFNIISILTGTGYATENFSNWGQFPLVYFIILMFIGQ